MSDALIRGFFAYPGNPARIGETISTAVAEINRGGIVNIRTWEILKSGGLILIDQILSEIDKADFFCADLTELNPNVMFELGYAVMRQKRIWPILDTTIEKTNETLKSFESLTSIGYRKYLSSSDIVTNFYKDQPHESLDSTIYKRNIEPQFNYSSKHHILYLKSPYSDDASNEVTKYLRKLKAEIIISDPTDSFTQNLPWYGSNIHNASGVVCHLTSPARKNAALHNAVNTLVAGMALGAGKKVLMLIEANPDYLAPLDVRDLLRRYQKSSEIEAILNEWMGPILQQWNATQTTQAENQHSAMLTDALSSLNFGEIRAENEPEQLNEYFVVTAAYEKALAGQDIIFVGKKGAGKTANFTKLASEFHRNAQKLVCKIQPVGYEIPSLIRMLNNFGDRGTREYAIESLWKFLIYTEVARSIAISAQRRPSKILSPEEESIIKSLQGPDGEIEEFSARLENCARGLNNIKEKSHSAISEVLHLGMIRELRTNISKLISNKKHISILIDDLDKDWDKQKDIKELSEFILILLTHSGKILSDLKHDLGANGLKQVSLTIFLRSDIFYKIRDIAPEPDKIQISKMSWEHPEELLNVIEERFLFSRNNTVKREELWKRYFCETVKGMPTKEYILERILPRPRDLVYFVDLAVRTAVNRRNSKVTEKDVIDSFKEYSKTAFSTIEVEGRHITDEIQDLLLNFAGYTPFIDTNEMHEIISHEVGLDSSEKVIDDLIYLNFLGMEISDGEFHFSDDPQEIKRDKALARNLSRRLNRDTRYKIHPAFWSYLGIAEPL